MSRHPFVVPVSTRQYRFDGRSGKGKQDRRVAPIMPWLHSPRAVMDAPHFQHREPHECSWGLDSRGVSKHALGMICSIPNRKSEVCRCEAVRSPTEPSRVCFRQVFVGTAIMKNFSGPWGSLGELIGARTAWFGVSRVDLAYFRRPDSYSG